MKKFNLAGALILSALMIWGLFRDRYGAQFDFEMMLYPVFCMLFTFVLAGIDMVIGEHRYGKIPMSAAWAVYWLFIMFFALFVARLYTGPSLYFGLGLTIFYFVLGIANLFKFFFHLYFLLKSSVVRLV